MVPNIFNLVKYSPAVYGERDLMTVRAAPLPLLGDILHIAPMISITWRSRCSKRGRPFRGLAAHRVDRVSAVYPESYSAARWLPHLLETPSSPESCPAVAADAQTAVDDCDCFAYPRTCTTLRTLSSEHPVSTEQSDGAAWCSQKAALLGLTDVVRATIQHHRDIWITEADFAMMAKAGLNAVRLPVGYWVLANTRVRTQYASRPCAGISIGDARHRPSRRL